MLSSILIILGSTGAALLFLFAVTRIWPHHARKESNDFTGAVVAVIGTTYAVILAFTLSGVWHNFQEAQTNEEQEANALTNAYRIAIQLQDPSARRIEELCAQYADNALNHEWPEMKNDQMPPEADAITDQLWQLAGQTQAHAAPDAIAAYQLMEELRLLTQYRRLRLMQARERLPILLWAVLIAGGVITVAAACFFGVSNFRFHMLQVLMLSFLISLVLFAIADIDRPYQGLVTVEPQGFESAAQGLQQNHAPGR
jgi:hypothetical protein